MPNTRFLMAVVDGNKNWTPLLRDLRRKKKFRSDRRSFLRFLHSNHRFSREWERAQGGEEEMEDFLDKLPQMDLMRSEKMTLVQLIIPVESAHRSITYLGELGLLQFRDVSVWTQIRLLLFTNRSNLLLFFCCDSRFRLLEISEKLDVWSHNVGSLYFWSVSTDALLPPRVDMLVMIFEIVDVLWNWNENWWIDIWI